MLNKNKLLSQWGVNLIPDVSRALSWLEAHPNVLKGICRGIERETLRVKPNGHLTESNHPKPLGSALKHKWITTDFAETLLEFITPVDKNIEHMLAFLRDIHRYVARKLDEERMWPFSMPCLIEDAERIVLAQYGSSNIGRMKTLYRRGLKNRYGALMQTIAGIHYNFSLPMTFWQEWDEVKDTASRKEKISIGYLRLIRNYYRFGWVIPYLFGASPAISSSFLQGKKIELPFKTDGNGTLWMPYATSLRLSNLGHTNKLQNGIGITFNSLEGYVETLKTAIKTPSKEYAAIGTKNAAGNWIQLNTNVLQIENELYMPIRPKRITLAGEGLSDALLRGGIEYIEIRSLDINPFSAIGVDAQQLRFLDLFLIWCILADAPEMCANELLCNRKNWNRVVLEGRKPNQMILSGCSDTEYSLVEVGKALFADLYRVAEVFDNTQYSTHYQQVCDQLVGFFDNPELTYSARILHLIKENGITSTGVALAEQYRQVLCTELLEVVSEEDFFRQARESVLAQKQLEEGETVDFETFLASYPS